MSSLWAPWRIRYILGERGDGCFLCRSPQSADDLKNYVLLRGKTCFVVLNVYPYNPGHLMVAPYKHTGELGELAEMELAELMTLTQRCTRILQQAFKPDGYNIGLNLGRVAGAGVLDHVHMHVVPRWSGDVNFMPVLADTRVLPQALEETYAELKKWV